MILYGAYCSFYGVSGTIIEYEVIKETEKTYTIKYNRVIKKSEMSNYNEHFFLTYQEAKKFLIDYYTDYKKNAEDLIKACEKAIAELEGKNDQI